MSGSSAPTASARSSAPAAPVWVRPRGPPDQSVLSCPPAPGRNPFGDLQETTMNPALKLNVEHLRSWIDKSETQADEITPQLSCPPAPGRNPFGDLQETTMNPALKLNVEHLRSWIDKSETQADEITPQL